jgi:hypothetical protein
MKHDYLSNGGMMLTGENSDTWRKTCPSVSLSITNPTWIRIGSNSNFHFENLEN